MDFRHVDLQPYLSVIYTMDINRDYNLIISMSEKQSIHVTEVTTKYGTNWLLVDVQARELVVKHDNVVEARAFRNLAEKLVNARIAIKKDWKLKNGVKTNKYFINGKISQAMARKTYEVVII